MGLRAKVTWRRPDERDETLSRRKIPTGVTVVLMEERGDEGGVTERERIGDEGGVLL